MRGRGIGWKADRCADPETCDVHLCVVDDEGGTAAVLGMWWGRQRIFSMKTLSGSGAYGAKASRSA